MNEACPDGAKVHPDTAVAESSPEMEHPHALKLKALPNPALPFTPVMPTQWYKPLPHLQSSIVFPFPFVSQLCWSEPVQLRKEKKQKKGGGNMLQGQKGGRKSPF